MRCGVGASNRAWTEEGTCPESLALIRHTADIAGLKKGRSKDRPFQAFRLMVLVFSSTGSRTPGSGMREDEVAPHGTNRYPGLRWVECTFKCTFRGMMQKKGVWTGS